MSWSGSAAFRKQNGTSHMAGAYHSAGGLEGRRSGGGEESAPTPVAETQEESEPEPSVEVQEEPEPAPEAEPQVVIREEPERESAELRTEEAEPPKPQKTAPGKKSENPVVYDNKWRQLCQMFETVQPFHDERSYLSITPKDFVVLTREFQPMVNNSFLLHGFYNYKHIILGKEESGREERYYLGVPGVYYDREKQVAVMFGFESFESEKEPAENGGFGYYMKRVDI